MATLDQLPIHPVPEDARRRQGVPLVIAGLVERPGALDEAALDGLPRVRYDGDFACKEGWTVPGLHWEGVRLADVLALAGPLPAARHLSIRAGGFALPLPLGEAESAVLCDVLDGERLTLERGAPWRLLLPGAECFTSVKWVERIDVSAEPGENTAAAIALARL